MSGVMAHQPAVRCPLGKDNTSAPEHCIAVNGFRSKGHVGLCLGCTEDPVELLQELLARVNADNRAREEQR